MKSNDYNLRVHTSKVIPTYKLTQHFTVGEARMRMQKKFIRGEEEEVKQERVVGGNGGPEQFRLGLHV